MKKIILWVLLTSLLLTLTACGHTSNTDPDPVEPADEPPYVSQTLLDKTLNVENGGDLLTVVQSSIIVMDAKDGQIPITADMLTPALDTTQAGEYDVTLTVTDSGGNTATFTLHVVVAKAIVETLAKQDFLAQLENTGWLDIDHTKDIGYGLTFCTDEGGFRFTYGALDSDVMVTGYLEDYYPTSKTAATFTGTCKLASDDTSVAAQSFDYSITINLTNMAAQKKMMFNYDFGSSATKYDCEDVNYLDVTEADMLQLSIYWHTNYNN